MRKVPELTAVFCFTKGLINGSSEWWPDCMYGRFGLEPFTGVLAAGVVAALAVQLSVRRYHAPIYWLAFTVASVAAKEAANGLHRVGLPYVVVAVFWLVLLAVILVAWRTSGGTGSPGSVCAGWQELFYWSAVGSGSALSQAVGHASRVIPGSDQELAGPRQLQQEGLVMAVTCPSPSFRALPPPHGPVKA